MYVVILCSIATVLFVYVIIVHVCICVKHIRTPDQRHQNVHNDHIYHTYDEIDPTSYRTISNTNDNQGQNIPELLRATDNSTDSNLHSLNDYTADTEYPGDGLEQREITAVQGRSVSMSSDDTSMSNTNVSSSAIQRIENVLYFSNLNESTETPNDQHSQTSHDSDSETSNTVMVGNDGDMKTRTRWFYRIVRNITRTSGLLEKASHLQDIIQMKIKDLIPARQKNRFTSIFSFNKHAI